MKTVTICGSMKFENEMKEIAFDLETKHNMCVLQCVYNEEKPELSKNEIAALNSAHFKKLNFRTQFMWSTLTATSASK